MPRGKKKIVLPEGITPMKEQDYRGMSREQIAGSLGLPEDATLKQINNAILEDAGLKGTRRSKKQELTEAERIEQKKKRKEEQAKKKKKRKEYLTAIGAPTPKERTKQTPEEKKQKRKDRREKKKKQADEAKAFALETRAKWEKQKKKIPKWMKDLK